MPDGTGLTRRLADWSASLAFEALPEPVIAAAKRQILDTLSCAWAGSDAAGIDTVRGLLVERGGRKEATVWALGDRLPAPAATRLNGMMAAALDYDSLHDRATVHADIVILPAVMALAERAGASGADLITALVAGDELLIRLGLAVKKHPGWFYTSVLGGLAAAAAGARLLGLDGHRTANAIGIALSTAGGTQQSLVEKTLTKRLQSAMAAESGVEAALLAERGITGPTAALEGTAGVAALYTALDADLLLDGLGTTFATTGLTFKKYPSCLCNHAAIEGTLELVSRHGITADKVEQVTVGLTPFMARLVGGEFEPGETPQATAQFSVQYSVASALLRGRLGLAEIEPDAVRDPAILPLARKVEVKLDTGRDDKFVPVPVTIRTTDGRETSVRVEHLPGTPDRPLTDTELRSKASACFGRGARPLDDRQIEELTERVMGFERLNKAAAIFDGLALAGARRAA